MNETKHTPGPWDVWDDVHAPESRPGIVLMPEAANSGVGHKYVACGGGNVVANARLVAAAPDLLKALKEYVAADFMACGYDSGIGGTTQSNAEAAINKATEAT